MVSLGLVGEVFEVRTQVDRDLTTVSRVDRRLRLIKNLGRHNLLASTTTHEFPTVWYSAHFDASGGYEYSQIYLG
jgi:hypothetical protein